MRKNRRLLICILTLIIALALPMTASAAKSAPELSKDSLSLYVGYSRKLKLTDGEQSGLVWSSNNKKIAKVNKKGKVQAKKAGTVTITVQDPESGLTDTCKVTVRSHADEYPKDSNEALAWRVLEKILRPGMTEFEKATAIHDWITTNILYDYTYSNYSVHQALTEKTVVCAGYADTYHLMAKLAGLEVVTISGQANNGGGWDGHAWNQILIDGTWYNVDTTWDANSDGGSVNHPIYDYYLISDATMQKDHQWNSNAAHTCQESYDRKLIYQYSSDNETLGNVWYVTDVDSTIEKVEKCIANGKNDMVMLVYETEWTDEKWLDLREQLRKYELPVFRKSSSDTVDGWTRYTIQIIQPEALALIPVVTCEEEFDALFAEMNAAGIKQYMVNYRHPNGSFDFWQNDNWPDGWSVSAYTYDSNCGMIIYLHCWN